MTAKQRVTVIIPMWCLLACCNLVMGCTFTLLTIMSHKSVATVAGERSWCVHTGRIIRAWRGMALVHICNISCDAFGKSHYNKSFTSPIWDLLMLQLLRPNSSNLPCLYSTFHLEYPLVLSRFCFTPFIE